MSDHVTTNHAYATPEKGSVDWHQPLNGNFDAMDADIEIREAEANLGNHEPRDGAKFLATDTGQVYIGDGEDWNATFELTESVDGRYLDNTGGLDFVGPAEWENAGATDTNVVSGTAAAVTAGSNNSATAYDSVVGGGYSNTASDPESTVSGGGSNTAGNTGASVGGGFQNLASGADSVVAGGNGNEASGDYSVVPGGYANSASGTHSFAFGRLAMADHNGAFVIGDRTSSSVTSAAPNEARFQTSMVVEGSSSFAAVSLSGDLSFADGSPQRTAGPVAKGTIDSDGTILNAVNIDSVTFQNPEYDITLSGTTFSETGFSVSVTPLGTFETHRVQENSGDMRIDFDGGAQTRFSFVVHAL